MMSSWHVYGFRIHRRREFWTWESGSVFVIKSPSDRTVANEGAFPSMTGSATSRQAAGLTAASQLRAMPARFHASNFLGIGPN